MRHTESEFAVFCCMFSAGVFVIQSCIKKKKETRQLFILVLAALRWCRKASQYDHARPYEKLHFPVLFILRIRRTWFLMARLRLHRFECLLLAEGMRSLGLDEWGMCSTIYWEAATAGCGCGWWWDLPGLLAVGSFVDGVAACHKRMVCLITLH